MTLKEIGEALLGHVKAGTTKEGIDALYAPDAISVEAMAPDGNRETRGAEAIKGKHDWWEANFTVHSAKVDGPFPHGDDRFAMIFWMDAENKANGERNVMNEVAVYHVADGKIVREEFFYGM